MEPVTSRDGLRLRHRMTPVHTRSRAERTRISALRIAAFARCVFTGDSPQWSPSLWSARSRSARPSFRSPVTLSRYSAGSRWSAPRYRFPTATQQIASAAAMPGWDRVSGRNGRFRVGLVGDHRPGHIEIQPGMIEASPRPAGRTVRVLGPSHLAPLVPAETQPQVLARKRAGVAPKRPDQRLARLDRFRRFAL